MSKVRWGVLGVAKIAMEKVIPAMQKAELCEIAAIASRDAAKAQQAAAKLGIPKAYGSYENLLADPDIDAIYIPLPNHLHVPWSIRCAEAGKHVLCEKPIGLNAGEARELIQARDRTQVKIGEAFMVRSHPQWLRAREVVRSGRIGDLRVIAGFFSYSNSDPKNIRNQADIGGGGLMDIGCYPINLSRWLFDAEPQRVVGLMERDPTFGTDRRTSVLLDYPSGQCTFTCSTQLVPYQRMQLLGSRGRIEVEIPFNAPPDCATRLFLDGETEEFPVCDQYNLQGDAFSRSILEDGPVPVPLEDALQNMAVIDAVLRSVTTGHWEKP